MRCRVRLHSSSGLAARKPRCGPALVLAALSAATLPAAASDYVNSCRTADGSYVIEDEVLMAADQAQTNGRQIPYQVLKTTNLKRETGYCVSKDAPGQKYEYESKSYVLRIAFTDHGQRMEADAICEYAADGLPAAYACDTQVVTSRSDSGAAPASNPVTHSTSSNLWTHNGSVMKLVANGAARTFTYETPRTGMVKAGARSGSVVFEGTRTGDTYEGTAYIFKAGCKPEGYTVAGVVSDDDHRITLVGKAPRLNQACGVEGTKDDTLVFDLVTP